MIKFENVEVVGWEAAIRGMRNPMNSWGKMDSGSAVDCKKCGKIEREGICTSLSMYCLSGKNYRHGHLSCWDK